MLQAATIGIYMQMYLNAIFTRPGLAQVAIRENMDNCKNHLAEFILLPSGSRLEQPFSMSQMSLEFIP